jgi:hypothetical protein
MEWKRLPTAGVAYYQKHLKHNIRIYEGQQQRVEEEFFSDGRLS